LAVLWCLMPYGWIDLTSKQLTIHDMTGVNIWDSLLASYKALEICQELFQALFVPL
jgi:hypothetical protein